MGYFLFKTITTSLVIATVSEVSKRSTFLASVLTALPLTSILIFMWMYFEQKDVSKIATMSLEVFFLVIPSLAFFIILPFLLNMGVSFFLAFGIDIIATAIIYFIYMKLLKLFIPGLNF